MAPLSPDDLSLLKDALDIKLRKEDLEHALGRALRNRGLEYDRYITITSGVRAARHKDESTEACARRLISEG
ncbi:MAG: hypothetical protein ISF22_09295 [Methanomassiliicoccus sp.]|nr:hypothetical protein [Methanomassiliicoccus sp.]